MKKKIFYFLLIAMLSITACADNSSAAEQTNTDKNIADSTEIDSSVKNDESLTNTDENDMDLTSSADDRETLSHSEELQTLSFINALGETHEMTVNPEVAPNLYDNTKFIRNDNQLLYDDPSYTTRLGIDVSYYQGEIDWEKVKADGYEFVFIRIGLRGYGEEGIIKVDEMFHENIKGAQNAGLDVGVYFFAQAINEEEAIEEANFVLEQLNGYELQMPVVYDPESILHTESRTDDVTGEQFTKNSRVFCETIESAGYEPMIYCNLMWQAFQLDLTQLADFPIWYADYESLPQTPYHFDIWQYSESGQVNGIDGAVDLNIQFIS